MEKIILDNADSHLPSAIKLYVCRLNDEKVVNPPQTPTTKNCRSAAAINAVRNVRHQTRKNTNQDRTHDINCQRSERKSLTKALCNQTGPPIAPHAS